MFKDYYLILGVDSNATHEEIEQAYKDADARINVNGFISKDFHDIQEAYFILSKPELKISYDKELEKFNASGNYDNYTIEDVNLAAQISTLQKNIAENAGKTSGEAVKIGKGCAMMGKGCIWVLVIVVISLLSTCIGVIMKQHRRNAVRNSYSYVIPQKTNKSCLQIITIY